LVEYDHIAQIEKSTFLHPAETTTTVHLYCTMHAVDFSLYLIFAPVEMWLTPMTRVLTPALSCHAFVCFFSGDLWIYYTEQTTNYWGHNRGFLTGCLFATETFCDV